MRSRILDAARIMDIECWTAHGARGSAMVLSVVLGALRFAVETKNLPVVFQNFGIQSAIARATHEVTHEEKL